MKPRHCQCSNPERSHSKACQEKTAKRETPGVSESSLEDTRKKRRNKRGNNPIRVKHYRDLSAPE